MHQINSPFRDVPDDGGQLSVYHVRVVSPSCVILQSGKGFRIGCGLIALVLLALGASALTMTIVRLCTFADTLDLPLDAIGGAVAFGGVGILGLVLAFGTCEARFDVDQQLLEKRSLLGIKCKRSSRSEMSSIHLGFDDLPVQGLVFEVVGQDQHVLFDYRELVSSSNASLTVRFACWLSAAFDLPLNIEGKQRELNESLADAVASLPEA
jgi:hypothetical protein